MKRREFIKNCAVLPAFAALPQPFNLRLDPDFTTEELIGQGNPPLTGKDFSLRLQAANAFKTMRQAAAEEGIKIQVVSSYRSYAHQNRIWTRKYQDYTEAGLSPLESIRKIIHYSTIPGTSRHHWGTDLDIIGTPTFQPEHVLLAKNFEVGGVYHHLHQWLQKNAEKFGFYMVYTNQKDRKGFSYEPWHFSFAKTSVPMLAAYQKLDLKNLLQQNKLPGSSHFTSAFIQQYQEENLFGINSVLRPHS